MTVMGEERLGCRDQVSEIDESRLSDGGNQLLQFLTAMARKMWYGNPAECDDLVQEASLCVWASSSVVVPSLQKKTDLWKAFGVICLRRAIAARTEQSKRTSQL